MARAAVVQMVSSSHVRNNLDQLDGYFVEAHNEDAKLIVLPENFAFMGRLEQDKLAIAENDGQGVIQDTVSQLAKRYGMWVIAGTIPFKTTGTRVKAGCIVYDDKGKRCVRYDKIHLFDVRVSSTERHLESETVERGDVVVTVDTPVGRVGLSVCYDIRFPELYQLLLKKGAEIFSVPAAFTAVTGQAHWNVLLRARAVENLCYVLAANQGGQHENGRHTFGHSMIIDPWGKVDCELEQGSGVVTADINLQGMKQLRTQFPCNEHHVLIDKR